MTQKIEANCDNCHETFTVNKIKSKRVGVYQGNQIRFTYFDCPKCKKKYFVGIKEKQLNKLIAKLKRLQKKIRLLIGDGDVDAIEKLQDQCEQLQIEIKSRSQMLKQLFVLK